MTCHKVTFRSYDRAEASLERIRGRAKRAGRDTHGLPVRAYRCADCAGWHLTSAPARHTPNRKAA